MGKGRKRQRGRARERDVGSDEEDGTLSSLSTAEEQELVSARDRMYEAREKLREAADLLSDKRRAVRQTAVNTIYQVLAQTYAQEALDGLEETIAQGLVRAGLRRGGKEAMQACGALEALWISVGEDQREGAWEVARDALMKAGASVATIKCLAMGCFLVEEEGKDLHMEEILEFLESLVARKKESAIVRAAVQGWVLVATTLSVGHILKRIEAGSQMGKTLKALATAEGRDPTVRRAAVEALAYLLECGQEDVFEQIADVEDEESAVESHFDKVDRAMNSMSSTLRNIANKNETNRERVPKGERHVRRELGRIAGSREPAVEIVKAGDTILEAIGIAEGRRLDAFRSALGGGLKAHVRDNPLLHDIFAITTNEKPSREDRKTSAGLRVAFRKAREIERAKRRRNRLSQLNRYDSD